MAVAVVRLHSPRDPLRTVRRCTAPQAIRIVLDLGTRKYAGGPLCSRLVYPVSSAFPLPSVSSTLSSFFGNADMNEPQSAVSTIITHHHVVQGRSREDGSRFAGVKQKLHDTVRRSVTRKDESFVAVCCAWLVEHQIGTSPLRCIRRERKANGVSSSGVAVNLLVLLALAHTLFPEARRYCRKFLELSYYNPASGEYTIGADDACLVLFWVVVFTGLRAGIMEYLLIPFARHAGIRKKKDLARFGEQAWLLVYYMAFWPLGMVCHILRSMALLLLT